MRMTLGIGSKEMLVSENRMMQVQKAFQCRIVVRRLCIVQVSATELQFDQPGSEQTLLVLIVVDKRVVLVSRSTERSGSVT